MTSQTPNIKWAERKDKLFVTLELNEVSNPRIDIVDSKVLSFSGVSGGKQYELQLELFGEVVKEDSKWTLDTRNIFLNIKKKEAGPYWGYINKDKKKYPFIHIDWNRYIDEDEEDEKPNNDMMGGFPGMGNNFMDMGGMNMGGMQHEDDVRDEGPSFTGRLDYI